MSFRLKYNGVVVIQSLLDDDKQTGKELFNDTIARRCKQTRKAPAPASNFSLPQASRLVAQR